MGDRKKVLVISELRLFKRRRLTPTRVTPAAAHDNHASVLHQNNIEWATGAGTAHEDDQASKKRVG